MPMLLILFQTTKQGKQSFNWLNKYVSCCSTIAWDVVHFFNSVMLQIPLFVQPGNSWFLQERTQALDYFRCV